jgi:cyclopropane fatty-acyl-phospholipid synthase-like methyltransferase
MSRNPMPSSEALEALYEAAWSDPLLHSAETGGKMDHLASVFAHEVSMIAAHETLDGLRILDFGAGRGAAMRAMMRAGAQVVGVEPFGSTRLRELGLDAYADLEEIPPGSLPFDGIVCFDVVEHLLESEARLVSLRGLLKPGGWFVVATPNARSLRARARGSGWKEARKAGHLVLFSPMGLETMLRRAGYADVRRLRWRVEYSDSVMRRTVHTLLQLTGFDGELRVIGWAR